MNIIELNKNETKTSMGDLMALVTQSKAMPLIFSPQRLIPRPVAAFALFFSLSITSP